MKAHSRNYSNGVTLLVAVYDVVKRRPGLTATEIAQIIHKERIWVSSSPSIRNQVHSSLTKLRLGENIRTTEGRNYVIIGSSPPDTRKSDSPTVKLPTVDDLKKVKELADSLGGLVNLRECVSTLAALTDTK